MVTINLIFPHQLFAESVLLENEWPIVLVEELLFFRQFAFHQQKLAFHRSTMKFYASYLQEQSKIVDYVEAIEDQADVRILLATLAKKGVREIHYIDTTDDWLEKRIQSSAKRHGIQTHMFTSPMFLNSRDDLSGFFRRDKKKFFQTKFYIDQRKKRDILLEVGDQPVGGKWSFDSDNRKKYPRKKIPPSIHYPKPTPHYEEAVDYVKKHFAENPGELTTNSLYPTDYSSTQLWLQQFFEQRFHEFGPYEDAIVAEQSILHHSVLTPMLNVGLIRPDEIIQAALSFAKKTEVPINSLEGFVRQIIGWREFIRGVYLCKGVEERTKNYWGFERKIPESFYNGTTGIDPIDTTIRKVLKTGYCHHIERLMVLGNFMLLCEFDPDEVYRWFMELFIDAYDWVMVPNVYGMSQFADGGLMSTKPYISGSNYLMKMSNYKKGDWQATWDALFWRFLHVHRDFFSRNPRLGMLVRSFDKMPVEKQEKLLNTADQYLLTLDGVEV